jgi:hypothetical protein
VLDQERDVFGPLPEGKHAEDDDGKPILEVLPEPPGSKFRGDVLHCDEKHRSPNRNMPEPLTLRGTDAKEFPILGNSTAHPLAALFGLIDSVVSRFIRPN